MMFSLTFLLLFIILIGELLFGWCLFREWGSEGVREVISLTALMLPGLLFICLFALNMGFLHSEQRYFLSGVAPVVFNIIWMFGIYLTYSKSVAWSMNFLSLTVVVALFCQWLFTLPALFSFFKGFSFWKGVSLWSGEIKKIKKYIFISMLGVGAMQINSALDVIFARIADPSGPAYLAYALRLEQVPMALFGIALASAVLPPLSRAIKDQRWEEYRGYIFFALERGMGLMIPCFFGLVLTGLWAVNLIYGHGDFSVIAIKETSLSLIAYGLGLFPMSAVFILAASFFC